MTEQRPPTDSAPRSAYYAEAKSWADDRQENMRRSRSIAWAIAAIAAVIALVEAIALASLAPLKRVELHTLLVDRQTGYTRMLKGDGVEQIKADEALTQSLLAQYVVAREGFDVATVAQDYRKVGLWSDGAARSSYLGLMQTNNPASPWRRLPRTSTITTRIKSVSQLGPGSALVRFDTRRLDQGQLEADPALWVAVIRYRFAKAPMSLEDRLLNPLGFKVIQYRRDQEAPPPVANDTGTLSNRPFNRDSTSGLTDTQNFGAPSR